jgi:hypothetical protein
MNWIVSHLFFLFLLASCASKQPNCESGYPDDYVPNDLNSAIEYLNCVWDEDSKAELINKDEDEVMAELHFGTGLSIRNGWGLWAGENELVKYFNSLGIHNPDDMSGIILTSFYRQLNDMEIRLDEQVAHYVEYWKQMEIRQELMLNELDSIYNTFEIGDRLNVYFDWANSEENRIYGPSDKRDRLNASKEIDPTEYCIVSVEVYDKRKNRDKMEFILRTRVLELCEQENLKYGTDNFITVGYELDINLLFDRLIFKAE